MTSILPAALSGLQKAASQADLAARRIVEAGTGAASGLATLSIIDATGTTPEGGLLQGVMDFRAAATAFKANARMIGAAGDMEKSLLDALRRDQA